MKKYLTGIIGLSIIFMLLPNMLTAAASQSEFTDVDKTDYYYDAVKVLGEADVLSGYPDGTFKPYNYVTRAEMAAIVCRMLGRKSDAFNDIEKTSFNDVSNNSWAKGYINIAVKNGIINGDGNGNFRPDDNVKYEEAVKMIICSLGLGDSIIVDPSDWSSGYILAANQKGIVTGVKGRRGEAAVRGDIAVMVYNGILYIAGKRKSASDEKTDNVLIYEEAEAEKNMQQKEKWEQAAETEQEEKNEYKPEQDNKEEPDISLFRKRVIELANKERAAVGIPPLTENDLLNICAQKHSEDMVYNNFFAHTNLNGESPFDRMDNENINYMAAAENIAYGQASPEEVIECWMNSDGHRQNILNPDYDEIGVGISVADTKIIYWTQCFIGGSY